MKVTRRNSVVVAMILLVSISFLFAGIPRACAETDFTKENRKQAEQGDAYAQYTLGTQYQNGGGGLPKNKEQAFFWIRKAAEQGFAPAQHYLAVSYSTGDGLPQDNKQAIAWYQKAAEQGQSWSQMGLGLMYANGQGVPQNDINAYVWFSLAAAQGQDGAAKNRDAIAQRFTPEQRSQAQNMAIKIQDKIDKQKK